MPLLMPLLKDTRIRHVKSWPTLLTRPRTISTTEIFRPRLVTRGTARPRTFGIHLAARTILVREPGCQAMWERQDSGAPSQKASRGLLQDFSTVLMIFMHFASTGTLGATVAGTDPCSTGGHPQTLNEEGDSK